MSRVYLDYNATTPLRAEARAAMLGAMDVVGNPSSVHPRAARRRPLWNAHAGRSRIWLDAKPRR